MSHQQFALFICVILCFISTGTMAFPEKNERFVKTADDITIFPESEMAGNTQAVCHRMITDNIIRVVASPKKNSPLSHSLVTVYKTSNNQPSFALKKRMVMVKPSFLNQNRKPEFLKTKHCLL